MNPAPGSDVDYVPLGQAAKEYGIPRSTLRGRFARGQVDGAKVDGQIRLSRNSLELALHDYQPRNFTPAHYPLHDGPRRLNGMVGGAPMPAAGTIDASGIHTQALRLDALHEELRRSERENQMLRMELLRYRLALDQKESNPANAEVDEALLMQLELHEEARRKAEAAAAAEEEARKEAEKAAQAKVEEARRVADEADNRARHAERVMAALAREHDTVMHTRAAREKSPWWKRVFGAGA